MTTAEMISDFSISSSRYNRLHNHADVLLPLRSMKNGIILVFSLVFFLKKM